MKEVGVLEDVDADRPDCTKPTTAVGAGLAAAPTSTVATIGKLPSAVALMRTFVIRKVVIAPTGIRGIPKNVTELPVTIPWKVLAPVAQPVRGVVQRAGVAGLKLPH